MPKSGTFGSVRGVPGNGHSYRDQFFSGMDYYEHRLPCDATQIGRFRVVVGEVVGPAKSTSRPMPCWA